MPLSNNKNYTLSDGFAIMMPYRDIFNEEITEQEVIKTIKSLNKREVLAATCKLGNVLENHGHMNRELQHGLINELFHNEQDKSKILKVFKSSPDRFLFFEQQLLHLIKLTLEHGNPYAKKKLNDTANFDLYLKKCVIPCGDLLNREYESDKNMDNPNRRLQLDALLKEVIRNAYFNSTEQFRYLFTRNYEILFNIAKSDRAIKSENYIDLESLYKKAKNHTLEEAYVLGFSLLAHYANVNIYKDKIDLNNFEINKNVYFNELKYSKYKAIKYLNKLTLSNSLDSSNKIYDFITLRQKPLIKISKDVYMPTSVRFVKERISSGIFWDIWDSLEKSERYRLARFYGELFEEYEQNLFQRMLGNDNEYKVFNELTYGKSHKKTSDIIIVYKNVAFFAEINTSKLKMVDTAINGDLEGYRKDLEKIVLNSVKQIDRSIKDFKRKEFRLEGVESKDIKAFVPIIVTINPFPQADLIWIEEILPLIENNKYLNGKNVESLTILSAEETEMMEAYTNTEYSFGDLIVNRLMRNEFKYKPMKHFLLALKFGEVEPRNDFLKKRFDEVFILSKKILFNK